MAENTNNRAVNAQQRIRELEAALAQNAGVSSVTVDGQSVTYNRAQALAELEYWRSQAARASGRRPLFRGFDLGSAW